MASSRKKHNVINLQAEVKNLAVLEMAREVNRLKDEAFHFNYRIAKCLLRALQLKDPYTYEHSARVAYYSVRAGEELGLSKKELTKLELAAFFHDVGKIGIPDSILQKPARLEEAEFRLMKTHPEKTYQILLEFCEEGGSSSEFTEIALAALHHHERYDGRGYPSGLKGEQIPLYARIILIADTFDAMTSTRPYRQGLPYEVAFAELKEFSGDQFDKNLVEVFISAMGKDKSQGSSEFYLTIHPGPFKKEAA
ncbi:MAG: HD-GYP domain-containing protein [Bdellovibrio sp.]|nr:HD-GYP domain-containing protein [Bdellovibrio sp.]